MDGFGYYRRNASLDSLNGLRACWVKTESFQSIDGMGLRIGNKVRATMASFISIWPFPATSCETCSAPAFNAIQE